MNLGPVGNSSVTSQNNLEGEAKKASTNGVSHIKTVYGDASKTSMLTAHMNRMMGFYASVKPVIDNAKSSFS